MAAPRRRPLLRTAWVLHRFGYRLTGGRLGSRAAGLPVLELTNRGRTTGELRSVLLNYVEVVARELEDPEREEQWRRMVAANPDYAEYEARTSRPIPVVPLERA